MANVIPFPLRRYESVIHIGLSSYIDQINILTNDIQRYTDFIQKEVDKFCAEVCLNPTVEAARTETMLSYMNEMRRKTALMELFCRTM